MPIWHVSIKSRISLYLRAKDSRRPKIGIDFNGEMCRYMELDGESLSLLAERVVYVPRFELREYLFQCDLLPALQHQSRCTHIHQPPSQIDQEQGVLKFGPRRSGRLLR